MSLLELQRPLVFSPKLGEQLLSTIDVGQAVITFYLFALLLAGIVVSNGSRFACRK